MIFFLLFFSMAQARDFVDGPGHRLHCFPEKVMACIQEHQILRDQAAALVTEINGKLTLMHQEYNIVVSQYQQLEAEANQQNVTINMAALESQWNPQSQTRGKAIFSGGPSPEEISLLFSGPNNWEELYGQERLHRLSEIVKNSNIQKQKVTPALQNLAIYIDNLDRELAQLTAARTEHSSTLNQHDRMCTMGCKSTYCPEN